MRSLATSCLPLRESTLITKVCTLSVVALAILNSRLDLAQAPAAKAAEKVLPVTTTVVVEGRVADDYLPTSLTVGSLDGLPLLESPVSATVVTHDLMTDQFSRVLSDVTKNDASIGEDYAPVGYYGDFQIRGFTVDLATGLQINGQVIAGEQDVPLENKEQVEFLKGLPGVESGVASAGGLINYVTKRPALVKTVDVATDHRGSAFGAVDLGRLFGARKQGGLRVNLAGESMESYVDSAHGWRGVGAASADWKLTDKAVLKTDFEYQHKRQRSEAGYQLLGGALVPDLNRVYPSTMLGNQPWSKPNIFDAYNAGSRLDFDLPGGWKVHFSGEYSHSLIDDNVIYPYGAALSPPPDYPSLCPDAPYYFFCPDGSYEAYDYRSPLELRIDATGEVIASGRVKTGALIHNLILGGSLFDRLVDLSPSIIYAPIGVENIYARNVVFAEQPYQTPGPSTLADFNRQASGIVQDRVELPGHVRVTAGGRYASVTDYNFAHPEAADPLHGGTKGVWLPTYSATWGGIPGLTLYGNYGVLLSLGLQAPFWATAQNADGSTFLAPFFTRQTEVGAKFEPGSRVLLTASAYRMRAPFFYPKVDPSDARGANLLFLGEGHETHRGLEFGAQGKAASWLRVSATAGGILARGDETGTAAFDGKQVINVPRFKLAAFADISVPRVRGFERVLGGSNFHLLPGWGFSGSKEATRDDMVRVAAYHLFNLGARYSPDGEEGRVIFRIYADNILNKRYWKDTGASYGDTFLHLGAPATIRGSASYRF